MGGQTKGSSAACVESSRTPLNIIQFFLFRHYEFLIRDVRCSFSEEHVRTQNQHSGQTSITVTWTALKPGRCSLGWCKCKQLATIPLHIWSEGVRD